MESSAACGTTRSPSPTPSASPSVTRSVTPTATSSPSRSPSASFVPKVCTFTDPATNCFYDLGPITGTKFSFSDPTYIYRAAICDSFLSIGNPPEITSVSQEFSGSTQSSLGRLPALLSPWTANTLPSNGSFSLRSSVSGGLTFELRELQGTDHWIWKRNCCWLSVREKLQHHHSVQSLGGHCCHSERDRARDLQVCH